MMKLPLRIERFLARHSILDRSIRYRHSDRLVQERLMDPDFPVLISFPRTGSHHLRFLMECYFEKPSLPRIFYYKKARSFTCCHMHDLIPPDSPAGIERKRVIYLYREPVASIHSVMRYYDEDLDAIQRIDHWSQVYRDHLKKWLLDERSSEEKILLRYEEFQKDPGASFQKLASFFGERWDPERFERIHESSGQEKVASRLPDNPSIIGNAKERRAERSKFEERAGARIREHIFGSTPDLVPFFPIEAAKG